MSHFKAKIHQIRSLLGLRPRPRWRSLQRSPRPLAGFKGDLLLRGGESRKEKKRGKRGKRRGRVDPQGFSEMTPLVRGWVK